MDLDPPSVPITAPSAVLETPTKKRKSAAGRELIRWDAKYKNEQFLLLALQYECAKDHISLPWDKAVQHILPSATGQAALQHLVRARKERLVEGLRNPPEISRRLSSRKVALTPAKKRARISEEVTLSTPQSLRGSSSRVMHESAKTPRRSVKGAASGSGKPPTTTRRSIGRGLKMIKEESDSDEYSPTKSSRGISNQRARRTTLKSAEDISATRFGATLRITEDINYAVSDEEIEDAEDVGNEDYQQNAPCAVGDEDVSKDIDQEMKQEDEQDTPYSQKMPPPPKPLIARSPTAHDASMIRSADVDDPFSANTPADETSSFTAALSSMNFRDPFHSGHLRYPYMFQPTFYEENMLRPRSSGNAMNYTPTPYAPHGSWPRQPTPATPVPHTYQNYGYPDYSDYSDYPAYIGGGEAAYCDYNSNYTYAPVPRHSRDQHGSFESEQSNSSIPSPQLRMEPNHFAPPNTPVAPLNNPPQQEIPTTFSDTYPDVAAAILFHPSDVMPNHEAADPNTLLEEWTHQSEDVDMFGDVDNDLPMSRSEQP